MLKLAPLLATLTISAPRGDNHAMEATCPFPITEPFAWAQREFLTEIERQYNSNRPVRIIVLKARQLGISTAMEGVLFWWGFIHQGSNGLVVAHENDASQSLFEKTKLYWDTWPYNNLYTLRHSSQRRLTWVETMSSMRIASAKNVQSARGRTLHGVHASECAFWDDPETLMIGLHQTIPDRHGTIVVLESTANGIGNWFHEQWLDAERGDTDYIPLFFPWWRHPDYKKHTTLCTELELTPDERRLLRIGADYPAIEWRRWAIPNLAGSDEQFFMQEYPATPEEAFITTGTNVFPLQKLDEAYVPLRGYTGLLIEDNAGRVKFIHDPGGPVTIFKAPTTRERRYDRYFVSGDPSETIAGDPACMQVINRGTLEQVAVWHGRIDPINFAKEMMLLGRYYHDAMLCPEIEGGGQATIATLINASYPHLWQHKWPDKMPGKASTSFGWWTSWQRKNWAIGRLRYLIADNSITLHDKETYLQLRSYITFENGEMGNANKKIHDDAVMALSIAVTASAAEGPFSELATGTYGNIIDMFSEQAEDEF
jgi:hypothetical protein